MTSTTQYLDSLGVVHVQPSTVAFDPGYDPLSVESHLKQSAHMLYGFKISMATWQLMSQDALRMKMQSAHRMGLPVIAGGGPFEVAISLGRLPEYLELCSAMGFDVIEVGEGFAAGISAPKRLVQTADSLNLKVQFELGRKFGGCFRANEVENLCAKAREWLSAGATQVVVEAREDAVDVGLFDASGSLNLQMADLIVESVKDIRLLQFEAPTKRSQFALIEHFGPNVILSNVRLEEILRVEVFRHGLHSKSFLVESLRPRG